MPDNPPILKLNYSNPASEEVRPPRFWLAYYIATVLGAIAGFIAGLIGDGVLELYKPTSYGRPDEIGIGYVGAGIVWLILIAIASFIVSCIFRFCCGRTIRRSLRFVRTAGAINGFVGLGMMIACAVLDDHHVNVNIPFIFCAALILNIALPIFMGSFIGNEIRFAPRIRDNK